MNFSSYYWKYSYVVDKDLKIVNANQSILDRIPDAVGDYCYNVLCKEDSPCENCPIGKVEHGEYRHYCKAFDTTMKMFFSKTEWEGNPDATFVIFDEEDNVAGAKPSHYNYLEIMELDYEKDSYHVVYREQEGNWIHLQEAKLSETIEKFAENVLHPDDCDKFREFWCMGDVGKTGVPQGMTEDRIDTFRKKLPNGEYHIVKHRLSPGLKTGNSSIFIMSAALEMGEEEEDKSERVILNREDFFDEAEKYLIRNENKEICLVSVDIEKFKIFNEWYGVLAGDAVLSQMSEYFQTLHKDMDILVGYAGNDDFMLIMPYSDGRITEIYNGVDSILRSHCKEIKVQPAFGVYEVSDKKKSIRIMADRAKMARAAVVGKFFDRIKYFESGMLNDCISDHITFRKIQRAFTNKQFKIYIQPKCDMQTREMIGGEALARMEDKGRLTLSPGVFITFMEKTGAITFLDIFVWEEVCRYQRSLLDNGIEPLPISVNVSKIDFYALDLPEFFTNLVRKYDLPPNLLEIEITESVYAENHEEIAIVAKKLEEAGFRLLMDDFGSAYSSLSMVRNVNVDVLKTDVRFMDLNITENDIGYKLLEIIYDMSKALKISTIVEGVETEHQRDILLGIGYKYAQGYLFHKPMPCGDFTNLLAEKQNLQKREAQAYEKA